MEHRLAMAVSSREALLAALAAAAQGETPPGVARGFAGGGKAPPDAAPIRLAALPAGPDEAVAALSALGAAWADGGSVELSDLFPGGGRRVPLPTYPWQRKRYWIDPLARPPANGHTRSGVRSDGAWERVRSWYEALRQRASRTRRIEDALRMHPSVRDVVVVEREGGPRYASFVAYLATAGNDAPRPAELRAFLQGRLPESLFPSTFIPMASLPRGPSGEVDLGALPALESGTLSECRVQAASREEVRPKLTAIFEEVMGVKGLGDDDDFFVLGGDSLLALEIFRRIERAFGTSLPVNTILRAPTIAKLAEAVLAGDVRPRWSSLVPMQPLGTKPPFFCVHGGGALVVFYYPLAHRLGTDQPFYGLEPRGASGQHPHDKTIEAMAAHYLSEIRQVQPRGPYSLGGASYGGIIALEMAQQLRAAGEEVALVAMFDTWAPGYYDPIRATPTLAGTLAEAYFRAEHHAGALRMLEPDKRRVYLESKLARVLEEVRDTAFDWSVRARKTYYNATGKPLPAAVEEAQNEMTQALLSYQPRPYHGKITLFRATRQPFGLTPDRTLGWSPVSAGGLEIIDIPCYHAAMISEPRVRILAEELRRCLDASNVRSAAGNGEPRAF
jgi:thioesterase domain-containing protein/acyl carrier protein